MPHSSAAKKALRQDEPRRRQNRAQHSSMRTYIKKAIESGGEAAAVNKACSVVDRAVRTNLIHKNKAARIKSKLMKLENVES
tara:strand:+ start:510 stop:755 length:246 start_codon:yes stop_codon:yes gene_type:complete